MTRHRFFILGKQGNSEVKVLSFLQRSDSHKCMVDSAYLTDPLLTRIHGKKIAKGFQN